MKRRQFVFTATTFAVLGGCGVLPNLGKPATSRVARVGILDGSAADDPVPNDVIAGLKQGLAELGYVDGTTIVFEPRVADSNFARLPELANELVQLPIDVLFIPGGTPATSAAHQATMDIPIVFAAVTDPVGRGFVASLDHPDGNVTGVTNAPPTVFGKWLEFLAQLVPRLSRVAIVTNLDPAQGAGGALGPLGLQAITTAANALGVQLKVLDMRSPEDVEPALSEALIWQTEAMINYGGPGAVADAIPRLVDFQLRNRIPMVAASKGQVQAGTLLGYGASFNGEGHLAATLVDKIIKGARPADLPVELPTVYELVVNQTTAQALGITIPPEVAQQVTEWVQ